MCALADSIISNLPLTTANLKKHEGSRSQESTVGEWSSKKESHEQVAAGKQVDRPKTKLEGKQLEDMKKFEKDVQGKGK